MTTVALISPTTLLGKELREQLEKRRDLAVRIELLAGEEDEVGTLTELGGAAAMVARADAETLAGADLVFLCGGREPSTAVLAELPAGATAVMLSPDAGPGDGLPLVAGVNLDTFDAAPPGSVLLSPHPGAILLAHLLHPLRELGLERAVVNLIQPASVYGEAGLDELYAQARRLVALEPREDPEVLPGQLAFNAFPSRQPAEHVAALASAILGEATPVAVEVTQGSVFHGYAAALWVRLGRRVEPEEVRRALGDHPPVSLVDEDEPLGPLEAAASTEVLVGPVRREAPAAGGEDAGAGYWIWAVMDNLTRGGALNALAIAERVLRGGPR